MSSAVPADRHVPNKTDHPQSFHISRLPCHVRTCQKTYVPTGHILSLFPKPNDIIQQFPQHFHISDCDMHYFLVGMSGQQFTRSKPVFPVPDTSDLLPVYRKLHSSRLYVAERHSLSNVLKSEHPSESTNESVHRGYFLPIHCISQIKTLFGGKTLYNP